MREPEKTLFLQEVSRILEVYSRGIPAAEF